MIILEERCLENEHSTVFPLKCFNIAGSVLSQAKTYQYVRAITQIEAFVSPNIIQTTGLLSAKECSILWANLEQYFESLKQNPSN